MHSGNVTEILRNHALSERSYIDCILINDCLSHGVAFDIDEYLRGAGKFSPEWMTSHHPNRPLKSTLVPLRNVPIAPLFL